MSLVLVEAPSLEVLSLTAAKAHLRVEHDQDNALIKTCIAAAVGELDAAAGGWLGRALRPQIWELRGSGFPCDAIRLSLPPFIRVVSLKYDDVNGVEQALAEGTHFRVLGKGARGTVQVVPALNLNWPAARCDHESVRLRFEAGYEPGDPATDIPAPIVQWIKLRVGRYYEFREDTLVGKAPSPLPFIDNLIAPYRVY